MKYKVSEYLSICFALKDRFGYLSSSNSCKENTTWFNAKQLYLYIHHEPINNLDYYSRLERELNTYSDLYYQKDAHYVTDWLKFKYDGNNEFLNKAKDIICKYELEDRDLPLVAALTKVWEKQKEALLNNSKFVGEVGKNIEVKVSSYKLVGSYFTVYGDTNIHQFKDSDGNIFIWKTSCEITNTPSCIQGKIKEHTEWNGIKQTVLTRCKIS